MTTHESTVAPTALIPLSALVAGAGFGKVELTRDLRAVAMTAASDWARANATASSSSEPAEFGQKVAQVYLTALRELEAGFEPELNRE